jgi:Uma2 family endonuclease
MYDLKSEDPEEPGLPDEFHDLQPELLRLTFRPPNYPAEQIFVASDLNLYYNPRHPQWYKRPDWFAVLGVPRLYEGGDLRLSYVIWQEGVNPFVAVELLSPGTEQEDLGQTLREVNQPPTKWEVYERILRIPYYIVFDRYTNRLQIFQNIAGRYQELTLTEPRIVLPELELGLGLWQGTYQGIERLWLRWYSVAGDLIPIPAELVEQERQEKELAQQQIEQERQRAEQERQKAEQERQRAEQLAAQLRALGIEPDLS